MAKHVIDLTPEQEAGVDGAFAAYNAANPDAPLADNDAYIQMVMGVAADSYATQFAKVTDVEISTLKAFLDSPELSAIVGIDEAKAIATKLDISGVDK